MGLFDDSSLNLDQRTFSWALGPYYDPPESLEAFPPPTDKLSVFIDKDGKINISNKIQLYDQVDKLTGVVSNTDPIDCAESVPTFSKKNKFVEGLASALESQIGAPLWSVVGIPTYDPTDRFAAFPRLPNGWVMASGYRLVYKGGGEVFVPDLNGSIATTGLAYIFKIGEERMDWDSVTDYFSSVVLPKDIPTNPPSVRPPLF